MNAWHGFIFLMLLVLLPDVAHAFGNFTVNPGSCATPGGLEMECSDKPEDGLFSAVACRTFKIFNGAIIPIYCSFMNSPSYHMAVQALVSLYVIFWGLAYVFGVAQATSGDSIKRLLKVVFIFYFISNQDMFFGFLYPTVMNIPEEIVAMLIAGSGSDNFYEYVDKGIYEVFQNIFYPETDTANGETSSKADMRIMTLALVIWKLFPAGNYIAGLFVSVIVGWIGAYMSIMIRYMLALMSLVFLLMLSPIFISTLLFDNLKFLGEEWIKMMLSFIIQIATVVAFVIMVEDFYVEFLDTIKIGYNEVILESSYKGSATNYMEAGETSLDQLEAVKDVHPEDAQKFITSSGYPQGENFVPWFTTQLVTMVALIYLTFSFMKFLPSLAGFLAGNPKFVNLMRRTEDIVSQGEGGGARLPFQDYLNKQGNSAIEKLSDGDLADTVTNFASRSSP